MLNRPIRVLYMIGGGEFGGAEQHVLSLIKGLDPEVCVAEVACFYDAQFAKRLRDEQINVTIVGGKSIQLVYSMMKRIIDSFQPDIIHTHGVRANLVGRMMSKLERIPNVTTVHSNFALDYPNRMKRALFFSLERFTRPLVHQFIAVSQSMKDNLIQEHVNGDRIQVIYNGVDTNYFVPAPNKKSRSPPLVVTVARLHAVKGHRQLLDAIPHVQTPAEYIFVGEGDMRSEIEHVIEQRHLPVHLVGHQQNILRYYQEADLVVQTSLSEGFSLSMAEALACEVPVVTTRVGGCLEIASHAHKGVTLVDVGDVEGLAAGIDARLANKEQPDRDIIVKQFSIQQMIDRTVDLYKSLV